MSALIDPLMSVLDSVLQVEAQLGCLVQAEKDALVGGNATDLSLCLIEKESLLGRLRYFSERLRDAVSSVADQLGEKEAGLAGGSNGLRRLAERLSEPEKSDMIAALQRLGDLTLKVRMSNQVNGLASQVGLRRMGALSGFLKGGLSGPSVYQATGRWKETALRGRTLGCG